MDYWTVSLLQGKRFRYYVYHCFVDWSLVLWGIANCHARRDLDSVVATYLLCPPMAYYNRHLDRPFGFVAFTSLLILFRSHFKRTHDDNIGTHNPNAQA